VAPKVVLLEELVLGLFTTAFNQWMFMWRVANATKFWLYEVAFGINETVAASDESLDDPTGWSL
jgi:hypothetical protein